MKLNKTVPTITGTLKRFIVHPPCNTFNDVVSLINVLFYGATYIGVVQMKRTANLHLHY